MTAHILSVPNRGLDVWREDVGRGLFKLDFKPHENAPFRARIMPVCAEVGLMRMAMSPGHTVRDQDLIRTDPRDFFGIAVALRGQIDATHRGQKVRLKQGEAIILRSGQIGSVGSEGAFDHYSMAIGVSEVGSSAASFDRAVMRPNRRNSPTLRLIMAYMRAIESRTATPDAALYATMRRHLIELIYLLTQVDSNELFLTRNDAVRAARIASIKQFIDQNGTDPSLSVETVAKRESISERYLQRLLEQEGTTFTILLHECRLAQARSMLEDQQHDHRRILDIALLSGFSDPSHFNRLFRRRFGMTPSEARERA